MLLKRKLWRVRNLVETSIMEDKINLNIGCVIYTETDNGIKAEWFYYRDNKIEHGNGIGIRLTTLNKKRRFEGEFAITYSDPNENILAKLNLIISFELQCYKLTWKNNERITNMGIGVERENKLVVSYAEVI